MRISKKCPLCNKSLKNFLDLGMHPCADTFLKNKNDAIKLKKYPLVVGYCDCNHLSAIYNVSPFIRYKKNDYSYTSNNSPVSVAHFNQIAKRIIKIFKIKKDSKIIEIGSNDGTFLKNIEKYAGSQVLGVDPATNMCKLSRKKSIASLDIFFNYDQAKKIVEDFGKFDVLYGANVFNHINNPKNFLLGCKKILKINGIIVIEVPDLNSLFNTYGFDTIYHEHRQYFSKESLSQVLRSMGFEILNIENIKYMAGSIRIFAKNTDKKMKKMKKHYSHKKFNNFKNSIYKIKEKILDFIEQNKLKNIKIVGIGAATKGNTLLNYCKINDKDIKFIIDKSPYKINKYTPGSGIKIIDEKKVKNIDAAIILPWNISKYLYRKILKKKNIPFTSVFHITKNIK